MKEQEIINTLNLFSIFFLIVAIIFMLLNNINK